MLSVNWEQDLSPATVGNNRLQFRLPPRWRAMIPVLTSGSGEPYRGVLGAKLELVILVSHSLAEFSLSSLRPYVSDFEVLLFKASFVSLLWCI